MTVTINGTTGIAGTNGSASTPAVQGEDTNTGVFFPAADTVAVSTSGTERARIHASGGVSIGTTSDPGAGNLLANGSLTLSNTSTNRRVNVTIDARNVWDGSLNGYLLLAKAYVGGLQVNSEVTGRIFLSRGSTGEGRRTETIEVFSKSAYSTENFLVHWFGGRDFTAGTLHKVTYGGTVYHAIRLGQTGGGPYQGFSFDGWTTNAGLVVALDSEVSNVTSFGSIGFVSGLDGQTYEGSNRLLNAGNYNSYAPTLTGGGASGTWGINITGNAATATSATSVTTPTFSGDSVNRENITARTESGFYETSSGTTAEGWPRNDGAWQHMLAVTHSNDANYYSMQLAAGFFSQNWYLRNTNGNGATGWSEVLTSSNYTNYPAPVGDGAVTRSKLSTATGSLSYTTGSSGGNSGFNIGAYAFMPSCIATGSALFSLSGSAANADSARVNVGNTGSGTSTIYWRYISS